MSTWFAHVDPRRLRSLAGAALLVGALAGLGAAAFATVAVEPAIDEAIGIEEAAAAAAPAEAADKVQDDELHGTADHDEVVISRSFQRGVGLFGAYAFTGMAFGLLLAVATFAMRSSPVGAFRRVTVAGAIRAGAVTVGPWLKYPPNPPAVGDPATLAQRQFLYLALIIVTGAVGMGAAILSGRLRAAGWSEHRRTAALVAAVAVPMLMVLAVLPAAPDAVGVPATLVWRFRLASLGSTLLLWTALTLGLGWLVSEAEGRRSGDAGIARQGSSAPPLPVG